MDAKMDWNTVKNMSFDEIMEANEALDHYIDLMNKSSKKGGK